MFSKSNQKTVPLIGKSSKQS